MDEIRYLFNIQDRFILFTKDRSLNGNLIIALSKPINSNEPIKKIIGSLFVNPHSESNNDRIFHPSISLSQVQIAICFTGYYYCYYAHALPFEEKEYLFPL